MTAAAPAVAYRAIIGDGVGPMMDLARVAASVGRAYRAGQPVTVEAMVNHTRHRSLTACEQERLVALATDHLTGGTRHA